MKRHYLETYFSYKFEFNHNYKTCDSLQVFDLFLSNPIFNTNMLLLFKIGTDLFV